MYRYIKANKDGFVEGSKTAMEDIKNNKVRKFKKIDDFEIKSKLYDIGYIEGYNRYYKYIKNINNKSLK